MLMRRPIVSVVGNCLGWERESGVKVQLTDCARAVAAKAARMIV